MRGRGNASGPAPRLGARPPGLAAAERHLADRFRLVAIDRRGFGRSTAPPDLNREVADLVAVRDALGLDRMVLVGMSQGGRVALHYRARPS